MNNTDAGKESAQRRALEKFDAPNGLSFFQHCPSETEFLYKEIFEDRVYFRHGISVADGDCVFDVGANIGLFTVFCNEQFKNIRSYSFEPGPEIFAVLRANVQKYGSSAKAYQCGISDRLQVKNFTYYPNYSIMSGFHADAENDMRVLREGIKAQLSGGFQDSTGLEDRHLDILVEGALAKRVEYACTLRPLSEIIQEAAVKRIDLLKVDAEGCELEVLSGMLGTDWAMVKQIVMEAHTESTAEEIRRILDSRGFNCVLEQEPNLKGAGVTNCFAVRR